MSRAEFKSNLPLVLLTADLDTDPEGNLYTLRDNYSKAILKSGGLPVIVPILSDLVESYLDIAQGVVITGTKPGILPKERRRFHIEMVKGALKRGIPLLGICHGMQLIGECLGGTLIRDEPQLRANESLHMPLDSAAELAHEVILEPGSLLASLSSNEIKSTVNSLHRCVLIDDGQYRVAARAIDGVVEAIEGEKEEFVLGLQWHPEYLLTDLDKSIFSHFIQRCQAHQ